MALALAMTIHAGVILPAVFGANPVIPTPAGPEALVMIDLPAELALPPDESVESVAAPDVPAVRIAEQQPADPFEREAPGPAVIDPSPRPEVVEEASSMAETSVPTEAVEPARSVQRAPAPAPVEDAAPVGPADPPPPEIASSIAAEPKAAQVAEQGVPPLPPRRPKAAEPSVSLKQKPAMPPRETQVATDPRKRQPPVASAGQQASQAASGAGRTDPDALSRFLASVRADIMRQRRGLHGSGRGRHAVVRFRIAASGEIADIAVVRSSGASVLDEAAVALVRRASPVPPIPADLGREAINATLPIRFD
ncbi:TonB family protein [Chthonobacter albigriseus]|uniref:TonB family protein n=1 Tax=Chthonobacter albigriseus TaxID=1683161 RepID=UPI0015EF0231